MTGQFFGTISNGYLEFCNEQEAAEQRPFLSSAKSEHHSKWDEISLATFKMAVKDQIPKGEMCLVRVRRRGNKKGKEGKRGEQTKSPSRN